MPNWCQTKIHFYSKDRNVVEEFRNKIREIYEAGATVENGFNKGWLGDYVNTLLVPEYHTDKDNCPRCRGSIHLYNDLEIDRLDGYWNFHIHTETAWEPMIKMWRMVLDKHYPKIKIAFLAEECGCELYLRHDPENIFCAFDNFYLQFYLDGHYDSHYFDSLDEAIYHIAEVQQFGLSRKQLLGKTAKEISEIADKAIKLLNKDNWLTLHQFEEVELDQAD
jgi:hypothetical protein